LDYLLGVMRDESADPRRRDEAARAAAPFLHPRLAVREPPPEPQWDLTILTDEEFEQLERITEKATGRTAAIPPAPAAVPQSGMPVVVRLDSVDRRA
jgi:hypothetical protein